MRIPSVKMIIVSSVVAVGLVAAASAQADMPVPFRAGEALTYDVSWTTFLTAGQATLSVKERRPAGNSARYYLVAEGRPSSTLQKLYHLYYKAESMLDTRTLRPAMATVYSDENGRTRHKISTFRSNGTVDYEIKTSTSSKSTIKMPATAQDPLGALYVLRAIALKPGQAPFTIPVTDSGKSYSMRVTVGGRESVRSGIGTLPAIKLTLVVSNTTDRTDKPSQFTIWISDDARRLPLKLQAGLAVGSVQLTLARVTG
jgi:hypothetical protein